MRLVVGSIRARLALWYAAVFALFLSLFALGVYLYVRRSAMASVDDALADATQAVASAIELESRGFRPAWVVIPRVAGEFRFRDMIVAIYDRSSGVLYVGDTTAAEPSYGARRDMPDLSPFVAALRGQTGNAPTLTTVVGPSERVRVLVVPGAVPDPLGGRAVVIGAAHSLRTEAGLLRRIGLALAAAVPLMLLVATVGGYLLARKTLEPVATMTEQAARIGASTLHERLPVANPHDELGRLATVINDLLARLRGSFEQQRQLIADASHELRTPVAIVSGEAELALGRDDRPPAELRSALATIHGEARRLRRIVDDLFLLARAEAGESLLNPEELYLGELAAESVRSVRSLAAAKEITLAYEGSDELPFRGDDALLRRLLINLLDNAIKYTPAGGAVTLRAERREDRYLLAVRDTGPGIPPDAQAHVFDRFYRVRAAHGDHPSGGGAGLGLAIARWIAETHGGTLELTKSDAAGSTFTVTLPAR